MRPLRRLSLAVSLAAIFAALIPTPTHAQTCDYQVVTATWHTHPDPGQIYVDFSVDVAVNFPVSSDSLHPTEFDCQIAMRFNGVPMGPTQDLIMLWWQRTDGCTGSPCPSVVCEIKQWMFKTTQFRDQSICALNASNVCGCPPLGTPVVEHKPMPKPPGPGLIEIEILPLSLSGCTPINPGNDKKQFAYPGSGGGSVPGMNPITLILLVAALLSGGMVVLRRRSHGGIA